MVQSWEQMLVDYGIQFAVLFQQLYPEILLYYHSLRKHNRRHRRFQHQNNHSNCKVLKSKHIDIAYHRKYDIKTYLKSTHSFKHLLFLQLHVLGPLASSVLVFFLYRAMQYLVKLANM